MRLAALVLMLLGAPASAQFISQPYAPLVRRNAPIHDTVGPITSAGSDVSDIRRDIARGQRSGQLSRGEAHALRRQATLIDSLASRYGRDGLSDDEAAELESRTIALHEQVDNVRVTRSNH